MQSANEPSSMRHSNVGPSSALSSKLGRRSFVSGPGPEASEVSGGHGVDGELARVLVEVDAVVPTTLNVCGPSGSEAVVNGERHGAATTMSSTLQMKMVAGSSASNSKVAVVSLIGPLGPEVIAVCAGVVSTVKARSAGVPSTFPEGSIARARNVCGPSLSGWVWNGEPQGAKEAPSTRHSKVEPSSPGALMVKDGVAVLISPLGSAAMTVSGARPSACQLPLGPSPPRWSGASATHPSRSSCRSRRRRRHGCC